MSKKKKFWVLLICAAILLATVVVLLIMFLGPKQDETLVIPEKYENITYNQKTLVELTDIDFLLDGKSEYAIVIPDEADQNESFAASDLQYFVKLASGAELKILKESEATADGKYFYIGAVNAADEAGVAPTYEQTKTNGFQIKLIGDDCYLRGYHPYGTRNSIYEFLDQVFDYEIYAGDEIYLENKQSAKMPAFDQIVNPAIDQRRANYGSVISYDETRIRMQMINSPEIFVTGSQCHNSFDVISPTKYDFTSEEYKDWFSEAKLTINGKTIPAQLCYSNEEMHKQYAINLIELIKNSPATAMMIGQQDEPGWCTCEKCTAMKEKYGTNAAQMIHFANKMQAEVDAWFAENRPGVQPTRLVMFAYGETVTPPAKFNEQTQAWEPLDETVVLNPNSSVMIAPAESLYDKAIVETDRHDIGTIHGTIEAWLPICNQPYFWLYTLQFQHSGGMILMDTIEFVADNYQYLQDVGALHLIDQAEAYGSNYSAWANAKCYVLSKISWDPTLHVGELIEDFFDNYYGPASQTMQNLFDEQREYMTYLMKTDPTNAGKYNADLATTDYWKYNQLKRYLSQIDQALVDIAPMEQTDPERYAVLYDRIVTESIQYRYLILQLYYMEYEDVTVLQKERLAFKNDCERLGISRASEQIALSTVWSNWGLD